MTAINKAIERILEQYRDIPEDHLSYTEGKEEGYNECLDILKEEAEKEKPCLTCQYVYEKDGSCLRQYDSHWIGDDSKPCRFSAKELEPLPNHWESKEATNEDN